MAFVIFVRYACKCQKMTAPRIESFPCNQSINALFTGFNSTRQRTQVKFKAKSSIYYERNRIWMPLKLEKRKNRLFYKIILPLHYQTLPIMLWFYENDSVLNATFFGIYKFTFKDTFNNNKQCHITLEGLNSVCAKLEPASSKNNEILKINVLQKSTPHALFWPTFYEPHLYKTLFVTVYSSCKTTGNIFRMQ